MTGQARRVSLATIALEWGRIGITGFGGPPAHIALLRKLCVDQRGWLSAREFEDGIAATALLPGPASTQMALFCAWHVGGPLGALIGGACFIVPGLIVILGLAVPFLAARPPRWVEGAAAGAGAAVPAVALQAALGLLPASWRRASEGSASGTALPRRIRWLCYVVAGGVAAATIGPALVVVLAACGVLEAILRTRGRLRGGSHRGLVALAGLTAPVAGGLGALIWVAFKVGALSYGGGFVIIPLMQHDAVVTYHWMTNTQFLGAVALGQVTPGPVVLTVAMVGYAAAGLGGALLATLVAFAPSFGFILVLAPRFDKLRTSPSVRAFLVGAGPAAAGAIAGAAIPLGMALSHVWQLVVLALACVWLLALRKGVVSALIAAGCLGVVAALAGAPIGH